MIGPGQHLPNDVEVLLAPTRKEKVEDRVTEAAINRIICQLQNVGQGKIVGLFQIGTQTTHVSALLDGQLKNQLRLDAPSYLVACGQTMRRFG